MSHWRDYVDLENTEPIRSQKTRLLRGVLAVLLAFCALMVTINLVQGNRNTAAGALVLMVILGCELIGVFALKNATYVFAVGKILLLTAIFVYALGWQDPGGSAIWYWVLAAPPLAVYMSGVFLGFWVALYGQIGLILLMWTPVGGGLVTPATSDLTRLPVVYFVISLTCLAGSRVLARYQLEQQQKNREMDRQLQAVTERRRIDRMTGLLNREDASQLIAQLLETGKKGAFFLMDVDNFKLVNDREGHMAGDRVLTAFADGLRRTFAETAVLARLGGDEFVVYVPGYESLDELRALGGDILLEAGHLVENPSLQDKLGASIGIALFPEDGRDVRTLYANADKAQYYAKRNGKNQYSFFERRFDPLDTEVSMEADLTTLRRMVQDVQTGRGAFHVPYGSFGKIYQFLERNINRVHQDTQVVLFTITDPSGGAPIGARLDRAYACLQEAVRANLRTGDLMMDFSGTQVVALLVNCRGEDGVLVAQRVAQNYRGDQDGLHTILRFELEGIRSAERAAAPEA